MGKQSNLPGRYFRAGIAILNDRKPIYDARLKELGLKTTGDLVNMLITEDGIVEALMPFAKHYLALRSQVKSKSVNKKELVDQLKTLTFDELQALLAQATQKAA